MKPNKQALKEVGIFWLIILGILSYTGVIIFLSKNVSLLFMLLLVIPLFIFVSFIIYIGSESLKEKPRTSKRTKRRN